jgi:hypothetical protein
MNFLSGRLFTATQNKMSKDQWKIRRGFIVLAFVFLFVCVTGSLLLPAYVGEKSTTRELALRGCKEYLDYAKFASTSGTFQADFSKVSEFQNKNLLRIIFNPNRNFWAKTNFNLNVQKPEPVILCKQQFYYPRFKNYFGWSYSGLKPAFAVGYSDGTAELISEEQLANLNSSNFVSLSSLSIDER